MAIIVGTSKNETLTGTNGPDSISGAGGNDILFGLGGNDVLLGEAGNDVLWGGDGNDTLKGGSGNDVYVVGSTGDVVDEEGNADKDDQVRASISVNLATMFGGAIEHADLTGSASINAIGSAADNELIGNGGRNFLDGAAGNDLLDGGTGNDELLGGEGNDSLLGSSGRDRLFGGIGNDLLRGGTGNDDLSGDQGDDTLFGDDGNDRLDGGSGPGNDKMSGGQGNDIYIVDSANDVVTEISGQGIDEVHTPLTSYTLGSNLENLLFFSGNCTGTGNTRANTITGADGNDSLNGEGGGDSLNGRSGNDTLDGGTGNDKIDGGGDVDTAVFSGKLVEYTITRVGGTVIVKDNVTANGNDGTDTLTFVEILQFQDGQLELKDSIHLTTLDGTNGFHLIGVDEYDFTGFSVSSAGDVNGDGFDDVIIGAPRAGAVGESYVVFGKANWAGTSSLNLGTLDGTNGFRLIGEGVGTDSYSGFSVSSAGDVNGDGLADFIVGARGATSVGGANYEGGSYVVFGKASWVGAPSLDLATLDGTIGFKLSGIDTFDNSGFSVSSAGDVNGDGFADLIVGAPYAESAGGTSSEGESYVVFGKASWIGTPSLDLATLDGANGFRLIGVDPGDESGFSVSSAGDVNGDGFADLIVGARYAESAGGANQEGESYVVFGKASWAGTPSFDLASLDGTNGFRLIGISGLDHSGFSVSHAGDVNGDGFADLAIGAPRAESASGPTNEGESYVVFGKENWTGTPSLDLASLNGTNGFRLFGVEGPGFGSGFSVSDAGDVNGDGFADMIVGAPFAYDGSFADGQSYVVYGKASWAGTPSLDLAALDGTNGFSLIGVDEGEQSGRSVSLAGDVNGDGFADLIVGAPSPSRDVAFYNEGESYVVFGGNFTGSVTHLGGAGDDPLAGTAAAETFVGGIGNDTMVGNGGADAFQGGVGNDIMRVSTLDFLVADGGTGTDTLDLDGSGLHLDLTALADSRTRSIERIDIGGTGNNTLTVSVLDVLNLSDVSNELLVLGDAGDVVNQGPGWTAAVSGGGNGNGTSTIDGQTYQIYNAGQASLLVDTDMTVSV